MEVFKVVPKLEDLATAAAYKAVEDDLGLCYGHDPTGMRVYLDCTESDQIRHRVKSRLDQTLVGVVGDKVRYTITYLNSKFKVSTILYLFIYFFQEELS